MPQHVFLPAGTLACVSINPVYAISIIEARIGAALVYVRLTCNSGIAWQTLALKLVDLVHASAVVCTG